MRNRKVRLAIAALGALPLSLITGLTPASAAPTPLPVSLSADGNGTAVFNTDGNPALTLGSTGTYAQVAVNLKAVGHKEPASPPSFTTSAYAAGSPRWVIELRDGYYLFGLPQQLGGTANTAFTGPQWTVMGPASTACGSSYETYAKALSCADPDSGSSVTRAYVVEDADQAANTTDTLTSVQYDGETVSGGTITITPPAAQTVTAGTAAAPLTVKATTTSSDPALTYAEIGLPDGLAVNAATGVITGTPAAAASSGNATVTVIDAYGDTAVTTVSYTVKPATAPVPVLSDGHVVSVTTATAVIAWKCTRTSDATVTIHGPGPVNGHTAQVTIDQATYGGLEPDHDYEVTIQPEVGGTPAGQPGTIDFKTS